MSRVDDRRCLLTISDRTSPRSSAFTLGISGCAFVPLQAISDRGDDIIKAAREKLEKRPTPAGLKEQYELQLNRMERTEGRAAHGELILFPGFLSFPSRFHHHLFFRKLMDCCRSSGTGKEVHHAYGGL